MAQQNNSDKTTFKVKFLGEYHDMVIDWNDDKYKYKQQQVFEQLASLTGIPVKYKQFFRLHARRLVYPYGYPRDRFGTNFPAFYNIPNRHSGRNNRVSFVKDNIHDVCIEDGERFHLTFHLFYDFFSMERIGIAYELIPETIVQEGVCSIRFCQHMNTESYFNKVKDLVCNVDLNSQISQRVHSSMQRYHGSVTARFREQYKIFREFNVQQFLQNQCDLAHRGRIERGNSYQWDLYLRMRG